MPRFPPRALDQKAHKKGVCPPVMEPTRSGVVDFALLGFKDYRSDVSSCLKMPKVPQSAVCHPLLPLFGLHVSASLNQIHRFDSPRLYLKQTQFVFRIHDTRLASRWLSPRMSRWVSPGDQSRGPEGADFALA